MRGVGVHFRSLIATVKCITCVCSAFSFSYIFLSYFLMSYCGELIWVQSLILYPYESKNLDIDGPDRCFAFFLSLAGECQHISTCVPEFRIFWFLER